MMGVGRREKRRPFFEVLGGKKKADDQSERRDTHKVAVATRRARS
jgi:hypothetical protein